MRHIFCDPTSFESFEYLGGESKEEIETLQTIASQYQTPELINDGEETAPSKRSMAQFPDYGKAKPTFGSQLAEKMGLQAIRSNSPDFNEWLSKLEALGNE